MFRASARARTWTWAGRWPICGSCTNTNQEPSMRRQAETLTSLLAVTLLGLVVGSLLVAPQGVVGQDKGKVVVQIGGGDWADANVEAYVAPFEKETGIKVVAVRDWMSIAKLKLMVESKKVELDVADIPRLHYLSAVKANYLEKIDYGVYSKAELSKIDDLSKQAYGVARRTSLTSWPSTTRSSPRAGARPRGRSSGTPRSSPAHARSAPASTGRAPTRRPSWPTACRWTSSTRWTSIAPSRASTRSGPTSPPGGRKARRDSSSSPTRWSRSATSSTAGSATSRRRACRWTSSGTRASSSSTTGSSPRGRRTRRTHRSSSSSPRGPSGRARSAS